MARIRLLLLLIVLPALAGCQERGEAPQVPPAEVRPNAAYLDHFGRPPQPERGVAYARVGYLPLRDAPDRLRAIPLFLFSEQDQLRQLLGRLVGNRLILDPQGDLVDPFPPGTSLRVGPQEEGRLTLELDIATRPDALAAAIRSLVETACQFDTVEQVVVLIAGEPAPGMPAGGYRTRPETIAPPGPPQPVMIAGMWEEGAEGPQEILFNFDRPVTVQRFELYGPDGERLEGDYFVSVFDMAVVVHPRAGGLAEGVRLAADWAVTDALGRSAAGRSSYPLLRFQH